MLDLCEQGNLPVMSFRRKWVSDTNLSKLLHETIEKKQANKQSKLPDFCKDAILGATIKKISSVMVINGNLSCKEKKDLHEDPPSTENQNPFLYDTWDAGSDTPMSIDALDIKSVDNELCRNGGTRIWTTGSRNAPAQSPCSSPKRKRQPSAEGTDGTILNTDLIAPHASPCKKRREHKSFKREINGDKSPEMEPKPPSLWCEEESALLKPPRLLSDHAKGQRSHSLPHLTSFLNKDSLLLESDANFPSQKSVVNSISELSIQDWEPTKDGSWCFPKKESADPDPLELNGFFQELKSVTVHPN